MAPYLQKALRQFDNIVPSKCQDSPYPYTEPKYGTKQQFAEYDTSAPVGNDEQKYVQKVTGKFKWYARGVDSTMLTPISALSAQQAKPTQATMRRIVSSIMPQQRSLQSQLTVQVTWSSPFTATQDT